MERLFVRGGIPISKVRIDFSSNEEVKQILKNKKMIFEDENTSLVVQPYTPPIKVLRCFNYHVYNQHVAANCPQKDKPICFRCGNIHPFNPNCTNKISCANCHQDHLAGSPNCPFKIEARKNLRSSSIAQQSTIPKPNQLLKPSTKLAPPASVWSRNDKNMIDSPNLSDYQSNMLPDGTISSILPNITTKLDLIMSKLDALATQQAVTHANMIKMNQQIILYHNKLDTMKHFVLNNICPFIEELSEAFVNKINNQSREKLSVLFEEFKINLQSFESDIANVNYQPIELCSSSPNESDS